MIEIRRVLTQVEDIFHEFGPQPARPLRRGVAAAVLRNPFAGRYEANIVPMMEALNPVGLEMARTLLAAMREPPERIEGYGKGAIVGAAGELEHGALWHVPGGYAMRQLLGWSPAPGRPKPGSPPRRADAAGGLGANSSDAASYAQGKATGQSGNALAIVPSTKKVGAPGAMLDVPLTHINASYVRSHFDAVEVHVPGAPRADEIVLILTMSTGARVHARVGGLAASAIEKWDGQR